MAKKISNNWEKQYQLEEDARTLGRYQEIMMDTKRKNAAIKEAKRQANDLQERANKMRLASGGKLRK